MPLLGDLPRNQKAKGPVRPDKTARVNLIALNAFTLAHQTSYYHLHHNRGNACHLVSAVELLIPLPKGSSALRQLIPQVVL